MIVPVLVLLIAQTAPPADAAPAAKPPKVAKVCRTSQLTASRLGNKKECRTPEAWAAIDDADAGREERLKRSGNGR